MVGEKLYFYDAIAPIVDGRVGRPGVAFRASRYGKGGGDDYLNLPHRRRRSTWPSSPSCAAGAKVAPHAFEEPKYFEGCLPIEVMAERGDDVLAFGPMKPVGLVDPRTGRRPLRGGAAARGGPRRGPRWNLVGFQTRLTWPEQQRIFRDDPRARARRVGAHGADPPQHLHRRAPAARRPTLALKAEPRLFFAGQITGVEGYVESTAGGLLAPSP